MIGEVVTLISIVGLALIVRAVFKRVEILEVRADINDRRDYRQDDKIDLIK
jgi:hypothetical protein